MTSDYLIYKILLKSEDSFIQSCNIQFINQSTPLNDDNGIYVGFVDLENNDNYFDGDEYTALVDVYIKTKDTDYLNGSRYLRSVARSVKKELKASEDMKQRNIMFRNMTYEYGGKYELKGLHLILQCHEVETDDIIDYNCLNVDIGAEYEER